MDKKEVIPFLIKSAKTNFTNNLLTGVSGTLMLLSPLFARYFAVESYETGYKQGCVDTTSKAEGNNEQHEVVTPTHHRTKEESAQYALYASLIGAAAGAGFATGLKKKLEYDDELSRRIKANMDKADMDISR